MSQPNAGAGEAGGRGVANLQGMPNDGPAGAPTAQEPGRAVVQAMANVAGAIAPVAPAQSRFDVAAVLQGPIPTKNNLGCQIHPKLN